MAYRISISNIYNNTYRKAITITVVLFTFKTFQISHILYIYRYGIIDNILMRKQEPFVAKSKQKLNQVETRHKKKKHSIKKSLKQKKYNNQMFRSILLIKK